jgi:PhnB protein
LWEVKLWYAIGNPRKGQALTALKATRMSLTPYLYYEDLGAALEWLGKAFGFRRLGRAMKGPDGKPMHAAMRCAGGIIMMGQPDLALRYRNPKRIGHTTQSLVVIVDDVERHFAQAKDAGAEILEAPNDTEYGHRRYRASDPEGHEWCFTQEVKAQRSKSRRRRV